MDSAEVRVMRRIALLVAAVATGLLLAVQPALAGTVSACVPSGQAAVIGPHAFAQPFTLAAETDVTKIHIWIGGSAAASAHITVQPLVPRSAADPTSPLVPVGGTPLLAVDVSPTSLTATDAAIAVHLGHLTAGSYALVVEGAGDLSLGGCVGPPFALYQSDGRWRPVPVDSGFALVLDGAPADHTPPVVVIDPVAPNPSNATQLAVGFAADEPATFACTIDAGTPSRCTSPFDTPTLTEGSHLVSIDATDAWGNATSTPAQATFTVDRTAPTTSATVDPPRAGDRHATVHASANEQGATFTCALDGAPARPCATADRLLLADEGHHVIHVVATDAAGNVDPAGVDVPFVADWSAPALGLPSDVTRTAIDELGVTVDYVVTVSDLFDPTPTLTCSPRSGERFSIGTTTVSCTANDASGNVASGSFAVQVTPPPITSAEVDISYDAATGSFVWSERDGGTIESGPDDTRIAAVGEHRTIVRSSRSRSDDDDGGSAQRLSVRSLAYDSTTAVDPGRNSYRVRTTRDEAGVVTAIRIVVRTRSGSITVRYDPATDRSTVVTRQAGARRAVSIVVGLVVPHLRSDHGTLIARTTPA